MSVPIRESQSSDPNSCLPNQNLGIMILLPLSFSAADSSYRKRLRKRSKQLFGNADRLEVAAAVASSSSGVVHAQELADQLGISPPRVRAQLLAFVDAGVMEVLPRHSNVVNYERLPDPFWTMVLEIVDGWRSDP
jgi:hypothetical protein